MYGTAVNIEDIAEALKDKENVQDLVNNRETGLAQILTEVMVEQKIRHMNGASILAVAHIFFHNFGIIMNFLNHFSE